MCIHVGRCKSCLDFTRCDTKLRAFPVRRFVNRAVLEFEVVTGRRPALGDNQLSDYSPALRD